MNKTLFILCLFCWFSSSAQLDTLLSGKVTFGNYDPFFNTQEGISHHTVFRPYLSHQMDEIGYSKANDSSTSTRHLSWFPVGNILHNTLFADETQSSYRLGIGIGVNYEIGSTFQLRGTVAANYFEQSSDLDFTHRILPNTYFPNSNLTDPIRREVDPRFRASYTPNKFFNFQAGIDQNFVGEGARSMLQGDHVAPAPFAEIQSSIWKIQFVNLYQFFRENKNGTRLPKFASSHMLNVQFTDRFQFGVFESVVFMPKDENWTRGFEIDYLNPFLFYRPQDYNIGSQDRLVIGTNLSYNFGPILVYGQFVLDDFVLAEIRARSRWWANKYGGQVGFKGKFNLNTFQIQYRSELNFARPFTFSHINESTTYGHQGIPLAHPLGANFVESYSEFTLKLNNPWEISAMFMYAQQGGQDSEEGVSYGNDIYVPYTDRPEEYGYYIGGNGQLNRARMSLEVKYEIIPKIKLTAFVRPIVELQSGANNAQIFMFFTGIRTSLWNERSFDY